jgi:cell division protein FtsB
MKFFKNTLVKITLVCLLLLLNLIIAQPSWAGKKLADDPDYIEVTKSLESVLQDKQVQENTPELEQKITNLKYQKYILENSKDPVGVCRNETDKTLLIYGEKPKKSTSTYDNELYLLSSGAETDDEWDCQGVYIPGQAATEEQEATPAKAFKIVHGTRLVVTTNPETGETEFNLPPAKVFQSGEANWFIPENLQTVLDAGITTAKIDD